MQIVKDRIAFDPGEDFIMPVEVSHRGAFGHGTVSEINP